MTGENSIDDTVASAWESFREDLTATLRGLEPGGTAGLSITGEELDETAPYFQFLRSDEGSLLVSEVSSNQVLTGRFRLSPGQIGELLRIGWSPPTAPMEQPEIPNFHLVDSDVETAVARVQETLQSVFGIPHPGFLAPPPREDDLHRAQVPPVDPHADEDPLDPDEAYYPTAPEDLAWAVSQALRNHFGTYRPPDSSGGFTVKVGSAGMIVTPLEEGAISVVAFLVQGMSAPGNATALLEELNEELYVRFHVAGTSILATCDIPAIPFVPRHLYTVLDAVGGIVDRVDDELATATGGSTLFEDSSADDRPDRGEAGGDDDQIDDELPEELLALIHLENDESNVLEPAVVARLMGHDRTFILRCMRLAEEQMIAWIASAEDEQDHDEKEALLHEARGWESTVSTLRGALRAVVTGEAAPSGGEGTRDDDEVGGFEFEERLVDWAYALEDEIDLLEPGETLFVTAEAAAGDPQATLSISRYLETGVLARMTWDVGVDHPGELLADLATFGWNLAPASGSTGPPRLVLLADTATHHLALGCLRGLAATRAVGPLDDLTVDRHPETGDWRRLPPRLRVDVSSFEDLRSATTEALEHLGAHPALLPGIRLESPAANHSVTVEVSTEAPVLHIAGPVVTDVDADLVDGLTGRLPDTGFDWLFVDDRVAIRAELESSPFQPGHLEVILAAAEDIILIHSRPLAEDVGGRSAVEDYLAEAEA